MAISSSSFARALEPGVKEWWGRAYDEWPEEYNVLFDMDNSQRAYEEDVSISGFGLAQVKSEGDGVSYDTEKQGFLTRYTHVTYALGFIITREMFEDDLYDIAASRKAKSLAFSMRQTKETNAANIYNRAFNSSYTGTGGLEMCSTAHVNVAGGTYANELTTAADLSEASLEQACIDIAKLKNDRGLRIALRAESLHIPVDSMFEIERILKSTLRPGTADNDINALGAMAKFPKGVHVNHYFTDTDAWFIRTNAPNGMKCYKRRAMEFGADNDFDTENAKFKASERYSFGWTDPRGVFGSPGA
jgi:hypothetical protein